jgi:hypothetical protein
MMSGQSFCLRGDVTKTDEARLEAPQRKMLSDARTRGLGSLSSSKMAVFLHFAVTENWCFP